MGRRPTTNRKWRTPRQKMQSYRARLRASGLRPIQIWVPDVRAPDFEDEVRRQSRRVSRRRSEREALGFIEAAIDADEAS
ncbi:MAG: antitoxin MazE family protein [Pseudomonadota bacterium]